MVNFTQEQLDAFWARYVSMKAPEVNYTYVAEPEFAAMLNYVECHRLYGFADWDRLYSGKYSTSAVIPIFNGPTKS